MTTDKEIRNAEIVGTGRTVSGYAVRFEEPSEYIEMIEVIHRGAITEETIAKSDVFALLNHREDVVLARSNKGVGSLKLTVDDNGLFYEFEAPNTAYGDELVEHISRGEISQSSFAFSLDPSDETASKVWFDENGIKHRDIYKIAYLYDCSPVYQPAYSTTTCTKRNMENTEINIKDEELATEATAKEVELLKQQIAELTEQLEEEKAKCKSAEKEIKADDEKKPEEEPTKEETEMTDETETVEDEKPTEETEQSDDMESGEFETDEPAEKENESDSETEKSDEQDKYNTEDSETEKSDDSDDKNTDKPNKRSIINNMEKFSLSKEIRNAMANGNKIDFRAYSVTDEGADVVQTDVYDIWEPLRAKNVLAEAGAKIITGLKNNVQIPVFGATSAYFADELGAASDGSGTIAAKKLSPKRVCAKVPVSLELLAQDNAGVEAMIRADIANAVIAAVEKKVFGTQAESTDVFAGMFNSKTPTEITDFAGLTALEATVEGVGVDTAKCKYVVSPSAKGKLRAMTKSAKTTQLVLENGEIDGTAVLSTGHQSGTNIVYGDFSNLVIATWDNVQIDVVRDTASLTNGVVTLVVNAYVDAKVARDNAFAYATV